MPQRDGAAVHVDLLAVEAQLLFDGQILRRKGFVDLDQVHVVELKPGLLQGFSPRFSASARDITTTAAPPSTMPEALPAVTVPVFPKAGFSLARPSMVVSGRRWSSSVNSSPVGSPRRFLSATGTNSS